jgi:hypothetical protein
MKFSQVIEWFPFGVVVAIISFSYYAFNVVFIPMQVLGLQSKRFKHAAYF